MNRPSCPKSALNEPSVKAEVPFPLSHSHCFSVMGEPDIVSFIIRLLKACSPPAVFRGISKIVINAVNGVCFAWSLPHVCKEILKFIPSVTNRDAPSSVCSVMFIVWIIASTLHLLPCVIFKCVVATVRGNRVNMQTTTRFGHASSYALGNNKRTVTASAGAMPSNMISRVWPARDYSETTKGFAGKIDEFRHNILQRMLIQMKGCAAAVLDTVFGFDALATFKA